jgi:glycolate oxidase
LGALLDALPSGIVLTDPEVMESYRYDRATFCSAGHPLAVVRARSTEHVSATMRIATEHRVPVVPQGARSGLSGAANAVDGCIVLSLEAMNSVLEVDVVNGYVVTQPGVMNAELSRRVAQDGLFYPPDPSSWEFCSIGGNLATNSGGLCCVKYGVTTDYVLGLRSCSPTGGCCAPGGRTVKGVAGYDLTRLFVGSEGTLGSSPRPTLALRRRLLRRRRIAATVCRRAR